MSSSRLRIGNGYDVHRFDGSSHKPLVLGTLVFEEVKGVVAHSDGDVVVHSIIDSLLGATGAGDIGQRFPPSDPGFDGAAGVDLLSIVFQELKRDGISIVNVDCTVVCDRPILKPYIGPMTANLSAILEAPVHVKGKSSEGLGFIGRGEGIMCFASALVELGI